MYLGSVRFYRHLIYIIMTITILSALFGLYISANLILNNITVKTQVETVESIVRKIELPQGVAFARRLNLPEDISISKQIITPAFTNSQISYQLKYPELSLDSPDKFVSRKKIAYLTFDDGPSARTLEILDILKEHDIKATFFVVTKDSNSDILRRIVKEDHTIGIHSHTHIYNEIYRSVEDFLDDFYTSYKEIYKATSVNPRVFRFPGGSINAYNRGIYQELISEMLRRGFLYYDWNISTRDTVPNIDSEMIINNIKTTVKGQNCIVILAHDIKDNYQTVKALPEIIKFLREEGYSFDKLENNIKPVVFAYLQN
jgi:peptidoglycan-N-acetylglucosamine deacetylase